MSLLTTPPLAGSVAMTVGGRDQAAGAGFAVIDPARGETFAEAPALDPGDLDTVFDAAHAAYLTWRTDESARREAMRASAAALTAAATELGGLLTVEQGKPFAEAVGEIHGAAAWLNYYAELEVEPTVLRDDAEAYQAVVRRPLGVVAAITPWNFPILLAFWKIAPALRAGNTVVVKPSPYTPLTTLAVGQVLRGVLPDGVLNVVSGPDPLGQHMVAHPVPRKISFTGSTATGKRVAETAAPDLKRLTLELGGNDAAVVLGDVDVTEVAPQLFGGAFVNNGQTCLAIKRIYAHESVHAELVEALAAVADSVKVDHGHAEGVQYGPLNNAPQHERVAGLVADAVSSGARAVTGGAPLEGPGYFYAPTIVDRAHDRMALVAEEQFGPALPVLSFTDEDDAVRRANDSHYGLTASVWSGDVEHAYDLAGQLDAGQVAINAHGSGVLPHLPFGGHKWSGVGVENGPWGLHGFTELQAVVGPGRS